MVLTLIRFDTPVFDRDGRHFDVRACGRERENGQWEAWLEFVDARTGEVLRTQRETTQPNLTDANYWATGLTPVYLEGALVRILYSPARREPEPLPAPHFKGPAPRAREGLAPSAARPRTTPVND